MRGTLGAVSPLIVVIARRDSRGQEHDLAIETLTPVPDDRRRWPFRPVPAGVELPAWHEHEEDD
jgi:hypothetical protein